jgi:ribonuclease III
MTKNSEHLSPESVADNGETTPADGVEASSQRPKVKQRLYPQLAEIPEFVPAPKPPESATTQPPATAESAESSRSESEQTTPEQATPEQADPEQTTPEQAAASPAPKIDEPATDFIDDCQTTLGYVFNDQKLLRQALTHSSIANVRLESNERLEFLGDSIMGCVICEYLFQSFPSLEEGELTRIKSAVVSRHTCAKTAVDLKLDKLLFLGKGLAIHERVPSSIMAAAFEALVAAIFLDGGWEAAREFVVRILKSDIAKVSKTAHGENYKSQLQQQSQKVFSQTPTYKLLDEKGPDHSKCFQVAATIGSKAFPPAWGASKKEAEQTAARNALDVINNPVADSEVSADLDASADSEASTDSGDVETTDLSTEQLASATACALASIDGAAPTAALSEPAAVVDESPASPTESIEASPIDDDESLNVTQ